jgi:hypothetical protein
MLRQKRILGCVQVLPQALEITEVLFLLLQGLLALGTSPSTDLALGA